MRIIKAANARNVLPFPQRRAEPLLIDRIAEYNRRALEQRRVRRRAQATWVLVWVVCAVAATWVGWWVSR
jgi:hypothetical protein